MTVQYLQMTQLCMPWDCLTIRSPPPWASRQIRARLLGGPRRGLCSSVLLRRVMSQQLPEKGKTIKRRLWTWRGSQWTACLFLLPETQTPWSADQQPPVVVGSCWRAVHVMCSKDWYAALPAEEGFNKCLTKIYIGRPRFEYACAIWSGGSKSKLCHLNERFCWRHQARLITIAVEALQVSHAGVVL